MLALSSHARRAFPCVIWECALLDVRQQDVANHQLQTLRPYLVRTAAQYEIRTFQETRQNGHASLQLTRAWLKS